MQNNEELQKTFMDGVKKWGWIRVIFGFLYMILILLICFPVSIIGRIVVFASFVIEDIYSFVKRVFKRKG